MVKRLLHKTLGGRNGFHTPFIACIAPVNRPPGPRFGAVDAVLMLALVLGTVAVMRFVIAR